MTPILPEPASAPVAEKAPSFMQPLQFTPLYQTRVWGGRRLETLLGRTLPDAGSPYGESWEISDRPQEQSVMVTAEGHGTSLHDLWQNHRQQIFGSGQVNSREPRFPLLMKILDACDDLSIQVHPPAAVAAEMGGDPKTEMWYVAHADPGARIYAGLRPGITREDFERSIQSGTVSDCVHVLHPKTGDCLFLPSGRIHAIGAGLLIYEIQQNSDTTYRVFDWNRVGLDGTPRALHVTESLRSIDFADSLPEFQTEQADGTLVSCEYFHVRLGRGGQTGVGLCGEHLTVAVVQGSLTFGGCTFHPGDFTLVPAALPDGSRGVAEASPDALWLEIRLP